MDVSDYIILRKATRKEWEERREDFSAIEELIDYQTFLADVEMELDAKDECEVILHTDEDEGLTYYCVLRTTT